MELRICVYGHHQNHKIRVAPRRSQELFISSLARLKWPDWVLIAVFRFSSLLTAIRFRLCQVRRCCGSFCVVDWRPLLGFFGLSLVPRRVRYRGPSLSVLLAAACVVDEVSASMNCTKRSQKSGSY